MIKKIHYRNWKSIASADLYIDPLTILIGANASGKSNALDGLLFLQRVSAGVELQAALLGTTNLTGLRGGHEWAVRRGAHSFELTTVVDGEDDRTEYVYTIEVATVPRVQLVCESLRRVRYRPRTRKNPYEVALFRTEPVDGEAPSVTAKLYNEKAGTKRDFHRSSSILNQIENQALRKEILVGAAVVRGALESIYMLDPIPSNMRGYSAFSDVLQADGSNIAGVIAALPQEERDAFERQMTKYGSRLPERDIRRIYTEPVGLFNSDAMLYAEEQWSVGGEPTTIDARGMSDGTLRFLAILTALLTRPEGSLVLIEEVDNGLHPSRSSLLLSMLTEIGHERGVDVLVTTHNPALLNAAGTEMIPFVVIAHRDDLSGVSQLTLVEDIETLPKLLAHGELGDISAHGQFEEVLSRASE